MSWDRNTLRQGIVGSLIEYSSVPFQRDLWSGKLNGYIGYYEESLQHLEDYGIPDFLEEFQSQGFLSQSEAKALSRLSNLLDVVIAEFRDTEYTNEKIWSSFSWQRFSQLAKEILIDYFIEESKEMGIPYSDWIKNYDILGSETST